MLALGVVLGVLLVVGVVRAATQIRACPSSWFPLSAQPASVQQQCSRLKEQAQQNVIATAQARPYATSVPRPIGTYEALAKEGPPVATEVPPGQVPPELQQIKQIDGEVFLGRSGHPRPITSVWQLGAVPSPSAPGFGLLLLEHQRVEQPPHPLLEQGILVWVMLIESGPVHHGPLTDVIDGNVVKASLGHLGQERLPGQLVGTPNS